MLEFDPEKDEANRQKHGVSLAFGGAVLDDPDHLVLPSIRPVDGEDRYKAVGSIAGKLWTAVFVRRDPAIRLISV